MGVYLHTKQDELLRESVVQTLRKAILRGEIRAGERLMEIPLSELFGVSRTPVREAIKQLAQEGLIIIEKNKGATVAPITEQDLIDVLEVRGVLDELAVQLACQNITEEGITLLEQNMKQFLSVVDKKDPNVIIGYDVDFHDIIYQYTGNKRLSEMLHHIQLDIYRYRLEYIRVDDDYKNLYVEHRRIADAIIDKNIASAKEAIRIHLEKQKQTILNNLRKQA